MKKIILFATIISFTISVFASWYFYVSVTKQPRQLTEVDGLVFQNDSGVIHQSSNTRETLSLAAKDGSSLIINNFLTHEDTRADVVNPGYFVLAGDLGYCLANGECLKGYETTQFLISYSSAHQFFHITLTEEPIVESRKAAEEFMLRSTGLSKDNLCKLQYSLIAPSWVNELYAGRELGFSFCEGSVPLE